MSQTITLIDEDIPFATTGNGKAPKAKPAKAAKKERETAQDVAIAEPDAALPVAAQPAAVADPILSMIQANPAMGIEAVERLLALYERRETDRRRIAFDDAMAKAKGEFPPILKNRTVSHKTKDGGTKEYDHEDLFGIAQIVDPILGKYGLTYRFRVSSKLNEPLGVTCVVTGHGHWEETTLHGGRDDTGNKNAMQSIGSGLTYLQRYSLKAALGLAAGHDDDGKASSTESVAGAISAEQADAMNAAIAQAGADLAGFLKVAKAPSVDQIPAKEFDGLMRVLTSKIENRGA